MRTHAVTGVASGSLGTGTALDDTQVYTLEELGMPEPIEEPQLKAVRRLQPIHRPRRLGRRPSLTIRRPRVVLGLARFRGAAITACLVAVFVVASVLTLRQGAPTASGGFGFGNAGAGAYPTAPTFAALPPGPIATPADGRTTTHGNGNGHGHH